MRKKKMITVYCATLSIIALIPVFIIMNSEYTKFLKKEIKGQIIYVETDKGNKGTYFLVGEDSTEIVLTFRAVGIAVGDSFYKPENLEEEYYRFFKRDTTGAYREIKWGPINLGECQWKFR